MVAGSGQAVFYHVQATACVVNIGSAELKIRKKEKLRTDNSMTKKPMKANITYIKI